MLEGDLGKVRVDGLGGAEEGVGEAGGGGVGGAAVGGDVVGEGGEEGGMGVS